MKNTTLLALLLIFSIQLSAQNSTQYSLVSVLLEDGKTIEDLAALGLEVDHGVYVPNRFVRNYFTKRELDKIHAAGFQTKILIEDWNEYFRNKNIQSRRVECAEGAGSTVRNYEIPSNFSLGDYGGAYYTYQDMLDILADMKTKFPNLITAAEPIGNFVTHDNNQILWLRLSNNADIDENEPEVLYTALHHAREPMSMTQLIFYMWYLLENYEKEEWVTYLLDHTELYFVPCLNPDGYLYNEFTNPEGGGLWRKNRKDNMDGEFGVDLNRNYSYEWGFDDRGSSPFTDSEVYRGPSPASEPETQAINFFCEEHEFVTALNYHSYGNLLIYPWGFSDMLSDDSTTFRNIGEAMILQNNYFAGTGSETVGYTVNGDADDWMYGEKDIYSMTPEVGSDFWTDASEIIPNCRANVWQNMVNAFVPHEFGWIKELSGIKINNQDEFISYELTRAGLTAGDLTVSLDGISSEILSTGNTQIYQLNMDEKVLDSISYNLKTDIPDGTKLQFLLTVSSSQVSWADTITKVYEGNTNPPDFVDNGDNFDNWVATGDWGVDERHFYSAPTSIGDSPNENYGRNENSLIQLSEPFDFSTVETARLNFWAKWDIEQGYDYAQILGSTNGQDFVPLCGLYTKSGTDRQDFEQPLWDAQSDWVPEEIDLSDYVGSEEVYIRFRFISDQFSHGDGFNFDDMTLTTKSVGDPSSVSFNENDFERIAVHPNPSSKNFVVEFLNSKNLIRNGDLVIYNGTGKVIYSESIEGEHTVINTQNWEAGIYFLQTFSNGQRTNSEKIILLK